MLQYVEKVIFPYVRATWSAFADDTLALAVMDSFKGQITSSATDLLESNNIHMCLLPPNTTDLLQLMNLSANKAVKDFLKRCSEDLYSEQVTKQ